MPLDDVFSEERVVTADQLQQRLEQLNRSMSEVIEDDEADAVAAPEHGAVLLRTPALTRLADIEREQSLAPELEVEAEGSESLMPNFMAMLRSFGDVDNINVFLAGMLQAQDREEFAIALK